MAFPFHSHCMRGAEGGENRRTVQGHKQMFHVKRRQGFPCRRSL